MRQLRVHVSFQSKLYFYIHVIKLPFKRQDIRVPLRYIDAVESSACNANVASRRFGPACVSAYITLYYTSCMTDHSLSIAGARAGHVMAATSAAGLCSPSSSVALGSDKEVKSASCSVSICEHLHPLNHGF